ncbi:MAG: DUF192 domain-containing protein [Ignavibacteria bacterium]
MTKKEIKRKQSHHAEKKKSAPLIYRIIGAVLILALVIFFVFNNLLNKEKPEEEYMFKKEGELLFLDSLRSTKAKIDIEVADNDFDRQLGLMFRKSMEEKQGMLFIFPAEEIQSFWMRNTNISVDMIFINAEQKIVTIHKNTKILSDQSYPSSAPAKYVLEVNAGFTDRHNVLIGDKVSWLGTRISF